MRRLSFAPRPIFSGLRPEISVSESVLRISTSRKFLRPQPGLNLVSRSENVAPRPPRPTIIISIRVYKVYT